uniref:TOG domain-containing protein n=1 Tax=Macrostomum lignano TaxID=282301 RepID=A0A1I8GIA9_9PLAT
MDEFYFDQEFQEQSGFNFDQYQYLFGLQPKPDNSPDDPQQPVGIIVKRPRSARHKSGGSDASDSINQLLHVTFKQTDSEPAQYDLDDDDDDSAFIPDGALTRPPSRRHQHHRDRWQAPSVQPTGIPAPAPPPPPVSRQTRRVKSRDPSPLDRGGPRHRFINGDAQNGIDQRRHNSQTRQMNRPVNSGAGGSQLRRPLHSGRNAISSATAASAGSIDEEGFLAAFEQVPKINVYSNRDAIECLNRIRDTLSSSASEDWEKRVDAMKQLRSLLLAGGPEFEDFLPTLRSLAVPFRGCISDLRSQVVREACITIAHLASCLGNRFDQFAEPIMEPLLALLGNTAKIVATCGMVCTSLLLRYTQSHRLLPSLLALGQAKSAIQRRCVAELMADQVLASWPAHALERQLPGLLDWLRRCLTDADQEARSNGRRAFWRFGRQFWAQAASILNGCDSRTRAAIERVRPSDMPAPAAPGATAASRAPQSTPASRGASPPRSGRGGPRS